VGFFDWFLSNAPATNDGVPLRGERWMVRVIACAVVAASLVGMYLVLKKPSAPAILCLPPQGCGPNPPRIVGRLVSSKRVGTKVQVVVLSTEGKRTLTLSHSPTLIKRDGSEFVALLP